MYYSSCNDSQLLSFVGFRNELAMLSTTRALLQSRLQAIKSVALDRQNATWWQKFALMYRDGQEDILNYTLSAIENMKQRTIHRMMHALNNNIHPEKAPFISILNPTYCQAVLEEGSSETNSLITLDNVVITLKQMLDKDKAFKDAVTQVIDDAEENEDVLFMLALIRERANHHSRWKFFFDLTTSSEQFHDEESQMEMQELHASLFPALTEECPDIFPAHIFTVDALLWADFILNNYSIDNPLAIVPL
ncbi:uncharacterized protein BYT42DRAFT_496811 [Radiomyces spectabilis]|uniref:uncharacterized protein n=1 Tax=Radiomyces spectabilis TaxID=64574 RepID=UPI0022202185|nr:uncharacterized protein BYT42DRAFT_496811 [Radiomyces spectabilis]KAI8378000.1 hypothetical protein BYT42DRAFT_496811 [Radiomyces spectabilis]